METSALYCHTVRAWAPSRFCSAASYRRTVVTREALFGYRVARVADEAGVAGAAIVSGNPEERRSAERAKVSRVGHIKALSF